MRSLLLPFAVLASAVVGFASAQDAPSIHRHIVEDIDGESVPLSRYRGKVLLVVNTASKCGFTPQYKELEALHKRYKDQGLVVLGFPCNDFGGQEPGTLASIKAFCKDRYGVTFPMFSKVKVRGEDKAPLYKDLTQRAGEVRWNFTKFLIDHEGQVLESFGSSTQPLGKKLTTAIEAALTPAKAARAKMKTDGKGD